jgi:hypothetical protein
MLFLFSSSNRFLLNALEEKMEDLLINACCAAISKHNSAEFLKGSLGRNIKALVLGEQC